MANTTITETEYHAWLRRLLASKGLKATDIAQTWKVDDALVSRFIKTGEGNLTLDRARTLAKLLGLSLEQLDTLIQYRGW